MRIESKICHLSEGKAIVQVHGWHNEKNLGSALAEGPNVEVAEDRAISRLNKRLDRLIKNDTTLKTISEEKNPKQFKEELQKNDDINNHHEPSDWSNELTAIDSEIERLKWSREEEINFLERSLGYNNRNKITNYNDILKYLNLLKKTPSKINSQADQQIINSLIAETDIILRELSWDNIQGRQYLEREFNVSTRKELNEEQLMSFVAKLRTIRNSSQLIKPSQDDN